MRAIVTVVLFLNLFAAIQSGWCETLKLSDLQQGGYVIFMRHAKTDWSQKDDPDAISKGCAAQRNLSDSGREQAKLIGRTISQLKIPLGRIISSKLCRTQETAQLVSPNGSVEVSNTLTEYPDGPSKPPTASKAEILEVLNAVPTLGTNTLLVSHRPILSTALGRKIELPEGGIVIFKPSTVGEANLAAEIDEPALESQWNALREG